MYRIAEFGSLTLPQYGGSNDIGAGALQDNIMQLPGGGLFDADGSGQGQRALRQIQKVGEIVAVDAADFRTQANALRAAFGTRNKLWRIWDDGTREWTWARMVALEGSRAPGNILDQEFTLTFTLLSPVWYGENLIEIQGNFFGGSAALTLINNGNAPVGNAVLILSNPGATDSDITSLTIAKGGQTQLNYSGTLSPGDSLAIDCGARSVKRNGIGDYASFSLGSSHSIDEWLLIEPGSNSIIISFAGGAAGAIPSGSATGLLAPPTYSAATSTDDELEIEVEYYDGWR